jgi:GNAT superfamily N-acetyltransferase
MLSKSLDMLDRAHWPSAEADNLAELLAYLGTGACLESYRAANVTWVITGVAATEYNGVVWARLTEAEADQLVPVLVERFRLHQLPAVWHLDPSSQPADLAQRLERLGCARLEPRVSLAAPVLIVTQGMRPLPHLTVERVITPDDLKVWMDIWAEHDVSPRAPRESLYAGLGLNRFEPLRHYLARLDGRPVGVSQLFLGQRSAGVYSVAVRHDYRGLGIGAALVQMPLVEARTLGYELAVLGPTHEPTAKFEGLGFERCDSTFSGYSLWP